MVICALDPGRSLVYPMMPLAHGVDTPLTAGTAYTWPVQGMLKNAPDGRCINAILTAAGL
jgi:hypothetical protein